jgi:hypothetical protein
MKPTFLRKWTLKIILVIFVLNTLAGFLYWYDIFPWFDNMMHFFGGFWVAVATMTIFWKSISAQTNQLVKSLFVILSVIFVGLVWEIYEFGVQDIIKVTGIASIPDSISDLVFDTIGAIFAFFTIYIKTKNHE